MHISDESKENEPHHFSSSNHWSGSKEDSQRCSNINGSIQKHVSIFSAQLQHKRTPTVFRPHRHRQTHSISQDTFLDPGNLKMYIFIKILTKSFATQHNN